jgi:hypothetical protein
MEISFIRSGGFAGSATNVAGVAHLDANGAHVSASGTDYQRDLPATEAKQLKDATSAVLRRGKETAAPNPTRDGFQYDISVKTEDGTIDKLTDIPPFLSEWVQQETKSIWEYRLANVRK